MAEELKTPVTKGYTAPSKVTHFPADFRQKSAK
jgi:hypothetical protein